MSVVWETELKSATRQTTTCGTYLAPALVNSGLRRSMALWVHLAAQGWSILRGEIGRLWTAEYKDGLQPLLAREKFTSL